MNVLACTVYVQDQSSQSPSNFNEECSSVPSVKLMLSSCSDASEEVVLLEADESTVPEEISLVLLGVSSERVLTDILVPFYKLSVK